MTMKDQLAKSLKTVKRRIDAARDALNQDGSIRAADINLDGALFHVNEALDTIAQAGDDKPYTSITFERHDGDKIVLKDSRGYLFAVTVPQATPTDKRVRKLSDAPCDKCGYNGVGYYQPSTHPCAATTDERVK